jgi:hypothetical protein
MPVANFRPSCLSFEDDDEHEDENGNRSMISTNHSTKRPEGGLLPFA